MLLPVRLRPHASLEAVGSKIPQASPSFWALKVLTTAAGGSFGSFLRLALDCGLTRATGLMLGALAVALEHQVQLKQSETFFYWLVVVVLAATDALFIDNLRFTFSVDVEIMTVIFSALLLLAFGCWCSLEKSLSIDCINTTRREAMYWLVLLLTLALGKCMSDLAPQTLENLSYGVYASLLCLSSLLAVSSRWLFKTSPVPLFWTACVLASAVGCSVADLLSASASAAVDLSHHGSGANSGSSAHEPPSGLTLGLVFLPLVALLLGAVRVAKAKSHEPRATQPAMAMSNVAPAHDQHGIPIRT